MPTYSPGPSSIRDPFAVFPAVMDADTFQRLGVALVAGHRTFGDVVGDRLRQLADGGGDDLAGDFAADVAPAIAAIDTFTPTALDAELVEGLAVVDETIGNLAELATTLPNPFEGLDELPPEPQLPDPPTKD